MTKSVRSGIWVSVALIAIAASASVITVAVRHQRVHQAQVEVDQWNQQAYWDIQSIEQSFLVGERSAYADAVALQAQWRRSAQGWRGNVQPPSQWGILNNKLAQLIAFNRPEGER